MAPITRRRTKVLEKTSEADADAAPDSLPTTSEVTESSEVSIEIPVAARGKRKSSKSGDHDDESTPNSEFVTPQRQRLAVRMKEEENAVNGSRKSQIEVQIPSSTTKTRRSRSESIADSQDAGDSEDPDVEPLSASKQLLEEAASQKLASQSTEPEPTPKPRGKHVVFCDDEDVEKFVAAAVTVAEEGKGAQDEADEESDDDDAPEAVSTQAAAKEVQRSAQATSEAAEKQAVSLKRKRQERDNLFKQQAAKRKRTRDVEVKPSKRTQEGLASIEPKNTETDVAQLEKPAATGRRRVEKFKVPDLLPAEFLTDSSSESEDESALKIMKKPRKITFETAVQTLGNEGKRPRDEILGSTRYRVLAEQGDQKLAPKTNKSSRRTKESLLKRRRVGVVPNKKNGFFVRR
ncbi:hypothetical protein F5B20DRAFT_586633 [Whalleya microplaca]|nr:hypothetical protein F5B20DRAFT_586633 [Whalleya microplaca]